MYGTTASWRNAETYYFFHGLLTFVAPSLKCSFNADVASDPILGKYKTSWAVAFLKGCANMKALIHKTECAACKERRRQRHRALTNPNEIPMELHEPPYTEASAIYSFNVPRYYSMLLRAREYAKQNRQQLSWCYARDVPLHPGDRDLSAEKLMAKLASWLSRHDQETCHLPGLLGLAVGMPMRLTDTVDRTRQLYRGRRGFIHGWTLHPGCIPEDVDGEWLLGRLPLVIYLYFPEAKWQIGKLKPGIYPLTPKSRTWKVNKYTGIEARRTGFCTLPDFATTAHMIQGATLEACFVDAQEAGSKVNMAVPIAAYVGFSRIKELCRICVL